MQLRETQSQNDQLCRFCSIGAALRNENHLARCHRSAQYSPTQGFIALHLGEDTCQAAKQPSSQAAKQPSSQAAKAALFALPVLILCGVACTVQREDSEHTQVARQALGPCAQTLQVYAWANGVWDQPIRPTSTHFCWLSKASGDFDGDNGTPAGVYVQPQSDGYWHLRAESSGAIGEARCAPLSCFSGDGNNDVRWVSGGFGAIAISGLYNCDHQVTNAWWGDAATVLQSWPGPGRTEGTGEYVQSVLSSSPWTSSQVVANDCQHNDPYPWIQATAHSLFVGTPSGGKLAHYTGVPFSVYGNYTLNLNVYTDDAFCFFTTIKGRFRGGGEAVRVYPVLEQSSGRYIWYAQSKSQQGTSVSATGRCYYYHQWDL
ncbi:MAG TPA: hypothetical protein PKA88_11865 [Polyangiaceae bacterium]|nr:hypothetical protein [Polyangiaceae bacterium]